MSDVLTQTYAFLLLILFSGAAFALGAVIVCRVLKWAPINITVNVNQAGEKTPADT